MYQTLVYIKNYFVILRYNYPKTVAAIPTCVTESIAVIDHILSKKNFQYNNFISFDGKIYYDIVLNIRLEWTIT